MVLSSQSQGETQEVGNFGGQKSLDLNNAVGGMGHGGSQLKQKSLGSHTSPVEDVKPRAKQQQKPTEKMLQLRNSTSQAKADSGGGGRKGGKGNKAPTKSLKDAKSLRRNSGRKNKVETKSSVNGHSKNAASSTELLTTTLEVNKIKGRRKKKVATKSSVNGHSKNAALSTELLTTALEVDKVIVPDECPIWYSNSISMFQSEPSLGLPWQSLIQHWATFEEESQFIEVMQLPATNHPVPITVWIQGGQVPFYQPPVNLNKYMKDFMAWWDMIQLEWRCKEGMDTSVDSSEDWDSL
jgi:hypothetical protein